MAGQPGDSGLEREVARPAQEAEGECDKLGKSPGPSPVDGELGLLQESGFILIVSSLRSRHCRDAAINRALA